LQDTKPSRTDHAGLSRVNTFPWILIFEINAMHQDPYSTQWQEQRKYVKDRLADNRKKEEENNNHRKSI